YSIANWGSFGLHVRGNLLAFEKIDAPKKLLINGPIGTPDTWPLFAPPEPNSQSQLLFDSTELHRELLRWYDYWLNGIDTGIMREPPVKYWLQAAGEYRRA